MQTTTKRPVSLKKLLTLRLMSQNELARKIDRTPANVSRYVNGIMTPRMEVIRQMSTILKATPRKAGKQFVWTPNEMAAGK